MKKFLTFALSFAAISLWYIWYDSSQEVVPQIGPFRLELPRQYTIEEMNAPPSLNGALSYDDGPVHYTFYYEYGKLSAPLTEEEFVRRQAQRYQEEMQLDPDISEQEWQLKKVYADSSGWVAEFLSEGCVFKTHMPIPEYYEEHIVESRIQANLVVKTSILKKDSSEAEIFLYPKASPEETLQIKCYNKNKNQLKLLQELPGCISHN